MSSWAKVALSDVAEVFNGKTPSKAEQRGEGHPVLKIRDVSEFGKFRGKHESFVDPSLAKKYSTKQVREGDNLILNAAHNADYVGSKTYRAEPPVFGTLATGEWLIIRPTNDKLDANFVHHWVTSKSTRSAIRNVVNGIHLYPKDVARLDIFLPPLPEQRRIAAILDQAGTLRDKRREALTQLDSLAQSIFIEMFGDPGSNPKEWPFVKLNDLIVGKPNNGIFKKNDEYGSGLPVVWVEELFRGSFINCSHSRKLEPSKRELEQYGLHHGDVLFCRSSLKLAGIGYNNVYLGESNNALFECHVIRISPDKNKLDPMFLNFTLRMPNQRQKLFKHAKTVTMSTIDQDGLLRLDLPVPPLHLQKQFAGQLEALEGLKVKHANALAELDALFASLQHRAFRGEL